MKKRLSNIIVSLMIIAGLSLLLYPSVSDFLKSLAYRNAITSFQRTMETVDPETYDELLASAQAYNQKLARVGKIRLNLSEDELAAYESELNIPGTDVMGYVVIPKASVTLPIYHGTNDAVLQNGVGHLEGSSLPVGGVGTHSILSGHRGLPSAKLFTNIDRLIEGDTFTVHVLNEVLTYEVDDIQTVLPNEVSSLRIEKDQDYCTLLTCTPYGVNTHRLLVRGHRIPTPEPEGNTSDQEQTALGMLDRLWMWLKKYQYPLLFVLMILLLVYGITGVVREVRRLKRRKRKPHNKNGQ